LLLCHFFVAEQRNGERKQISESRNRKFACSLNANIALRAGANIASPDFPSGASPALPRYKNQNEKDIYRFCASLAALPPRAAGKESK
jgi:hypothetical protein